MAWSSDIEKAPRGKYAVKSQRIRGGKSAVHKVFERAVIWIVTPCGKITRSYYIPEQKRWCMLCAGQDPIAWHPFDENDFDLVRENGKDVKRYRKPAFEFPGQEAA